MAVRRVRPAPHSHHFQRSPCLQSSWLLTKSAKHHMLGMVMNLAQHVKQLLSSCTLGSDPAGGDWSVTQL